MTAAEKNDLFSAIRDKLSTAARVAVLCHAYSDGDAVGSALAMGSVVSRSCGAEVRVIFEEKPDGKFGFIPGIDAVTVWPEGQDRYDVVVTVDTGSAHLLGARQSLLDGAFVISLDHHGNCVPYADIDVREADYSSCAELVYEYVRFAGGEPTDYEALCIYTGMISDTGGFSQKNTTPQSLVYAGHLIGAAAIPVADVYDSIFRNVSRARNSVLGFCLTNAVYAAGGRLCASYIPLSLMRETGCSDGETDGIVNALFATKGCEIAALVRETTDGATKCSLRSRSVDVSQVAAHFGGGGHRNASGCRFDVSAREGMEIIIRYITENGIV